MSDILILVGTESGNAQKVADVLGNDLRSRGYSVDITSDFGNSDGLFEGRGIVLICCATRGSGDLPDNIKPLKFHLDTVPQYLGHIRYGVIALGDQSFGDTFCGGGKIIDETLADLGAARIGERLEIDACSQPEPEQDALRWCREWTEQL